MLCKICKSNEVKYWIGREIHTNLIFAHPVQNFHTKEYLSKWFNVDNIKFLCKECFIPEIKTECMIDLMKNVSNKIYYSYPGYDKWNFYTIKELEDEINKDTRV